MQYIEKENRDGICLVWLDQPGEKVNVLNRDLMTEFPLLLDSLAADEAVEAAVLISRKPGGFIAGADIDMLKACETSEQAMSLSQEGQKLLQRVSDFPKPIVAAIHGPCLGGGLEVALACHYRIATKESKTVLGLPEVKLGLLPGSGGTQRLPELIGLKSALDAILTGKNIYAKKAYRLGLVDMLVPLEGLDDSAVAFTRKRLKNRSQKRPKRPLVERFLEAIPIGRSVMFKMAEKTVLAKTYGNYPAPFEILKAIKAGYPRSPSQGFKQEAEGFGRLVVSPEGQALMKLFFSMNAAKKMPEKNPARPVRRLGVLGAGLMGSGIAEVSASETLDVWLKDLNIEALAAAEKNLDLHFQKQVKKRIISPFQAQRSASFIHYTTDYKHLSKADVVIEAVFEDLEIKQKVLAEVEENTPSHCIFASNTSAIPIKAIAENARRKSQVLGMHYFSPVGKMPLLEIIVTPETEDWVVATAKALGVQQGKNVIVVADGPGFYTTRILAPMLNEALLILDEGGEIETLDLAMRRFGFPVGPAALIDEVGIDVGAHVSETLEDLFKSHGGTTSVGFSKLVEAGYLGRKNGKGFYHYGGKGKKEVNGEVYQFFGGTSRKKIAIQDIQNRLTYMMVNEAAHCLSENIIKSPADGDLGAILGLGFPPFLGGPFHWMDQVGAAKTKDTLLELADRFGPRFHPAKVINTGERFY